MKQRRLSAVLVAGLLAWCDVPVQSTEAAVDPMSAAAIRGVMTRAADWQLEHPQHAPDHWANAVFYAGLMAAARATGNERYVHELVEIGERLEWRPGSSYRHADHHAIAQTYLEIYEIRGDQAMIEPFRQSIDRMMATPPDWEKAHQSIDYWWSDALFMSPPALAGLARATGDDAYLGFMDELWRQSFELLWSSQSRLFYRDVRFRVEKPGEFWSRGNAWVLAGLARMLELMPEDRPSRAFYLDVFRQMAERVAGLQGEDGLWRASLLDQSKRSPGETSGSALFCHALAWGIRSGVLEADIYGPVVEGAWLALTRAVNDDGRLGWVQKPGASPQRVRQRHWAAYGTGALLLAGAEVLSMTWD